MEGLIFGILRYVMCNDTINRMLVILKEKSTIKK